MITKDLKRRECDPQGCGYWLAPRGSRRHHGVDLCAEPGDEIRSPVTGTVTKLGFPYSAKNKLHLRYVQVTTVNNYHYRIFYVSPEVKVGDPIQAGDVIGKAQMTGNLYPGITEHVHFEIKDQDGRYIDPNPMLEALKEFA